MFYYISKIFWFFTVPSNLFISIIILGALLLMFTSRRKLGFSFILGSAAIMLFCGLGPVANWLMLPLENRFPAFQAENETSITGIIVLGGAAMPEESFQRGTLTLNEAGERIMALGDLARRYPSAKLVFSGGGGTLFRDHISEAAAVRHFAGTLGLDPERLILEEKSRSTAENALYSKELMNPKPDEIWLLVTSAWHMPRAIGTFRQAGFNVTAYPVDYRTRGNQDIIRTFAFLSEGLRRLDTVSKEWVGLTGYWLMGRSESLFPKP